MLLGFWQAQMEVPVGQEADQAVDQAVGQPLDPGQASASQEEEEEGTARQSSPRHGHHWERREHVRSPTRRRRCRPRRDAWHDATVNAGIYNIIIIFNLWI